MLVIVFLLVASGCETVEPWQRGTLQRKSNQQLARALERQSKVPRNTLNPEIKTVKRGKGRGGSRSVHMGAAFLHRAMVADNAYHVHPKCERVIESTERWDGRADSPWKHILDAERYALDNYIFGNWRIQSQPTLYVY